MEIHSSFVAHYETTVGAILNILSRFQEVKHLVFEGLVLLEDGNGSQMKFQVLKQRKFDVKKCVTNA